MKSITFALVLVFAVYFAEAKSFGAPVVVAKRDVTAQAELLAKLAALLTKSGGIVSALEKEGKPLLAAGIKKVEQLLKSLEEKVKNANPHTELGKLALKALDELIIKAEEKLEEELKKVEGKTVAKREIVAQAELLLKLAELLSKSKLAQELLEKEGKPLLAAGLKKVDELLHSLEEKVKNASPHTEIGKLALKALDSLILKAEEKLEEELKKLQGTKTLVKRDITAQAELLAKLAALLTKSGGIVSALEKNGKPLLAAGIKKIEELLKSLEEKVKNANPHTEIGKLALKALDELIIKAEEKLEEELKKVEGKTVAKREIVAQAELLLKLAELLSKSKLAQELLEKEGKPLLAAGLKKVDELLHSLEEKVKNASPHTEIGKIALKALDSLILKAEEKLEEELKKLQGTKTVAKRDLGTQAQLLLKLAQLLSKSKLAQELLEKEGKPLLAAGLKKVDELLHSLQTKVEKASPHTEFGKLILKGLDWLIQAAEHKLEEELTKIQGVKATTAASAFYEAIDLKDGLLKTAQQLKEAAEKAIAFLKAQGKSIEATELELLESVVTDIEKKLETLEPHTDIGKMLLSGLESLLKSAETKLADLLKKLDAHP